MLTITSLYAGIFGIMSIAIASRAGGLRGKTGISIGDGGNKELLLAMRRHGNFAEYVPIALILLGLLEMNNVSNTALHVLGAGLVVARLAHFFGLQADTIQGIGRLIGAAGTALIIVVASIWSIVNFF